MGAHPKIFRGNHPEVSPSIPIGWRNLVDEFCLLLELICDERELASLQFRRIVEESGRLVFDFTFGCELSEHQTGTIDARLFALSNSSVFTCSICGRLVETLPTTTTMLCKKHGNLI